MGIGYALGRNMLVLRRSELKSVGIAGAKAQIKRGDLWQR